jgi:hypothetical protein
MYQPVSGSKRVEYSLVCDGRVRWTATVFAPAGGDAGAKACREQRVQLRAVRRPVAVSGAAKTGGSAPDAQAAHSAVNGQVKFVESARIWDQCTQQASSSCR